LASHFGALVLLAIAVIPLMAYIRFAPHKPEHWHIDPEEAPRRGKPNRLLLTGPEALIVPASVEDTAHMIKDIALATDNQHRSEIPRLYLLSDQRSRDRRLARFGLCAGTFWVSRFRDEPQAGRWLDCVTVAARSG